MAVYRSSQVGAGGTSYYSDIATHSGRLAALTRKGGGTGDGDMRSWPTTDLVLRVKMQIWFPAGVTRHIEVTVDEMTMHMFGEIS